MDLRAKLSRLVNAGPGSRTKPVEKTVITGTREERIAQLRERLGALEACHAAETFAPWAPSNSPVGLPGAPQDTPHGTIWKIDNVLEPDHHYGRVPIRNALTVDPEVVAQLTLDPVFEQVDPKGMLLLDTETTGLSVGSGTIPFLIGLAWFDDQSLVIEQLFLGELGEEAPMLSLLRERMERATCLVTYNGKTYDWPLIVNRFVLNRLAPPLNLPHLDLLHCARRAYKKRLESVRLVNVEEQVLGMQRERDVDGSEIPSLYWSFLRDRLGAVMQPVIEHNANDLVALTALLATLNEHFQTLDPRDDPRDHLSFAKMALRAKDESRALRFAEHAVQGGGTADLTCEAALFVSRLYGRMKKWESARETLEGAMMNLGHDSSQSSALHLRLAILFEHRLKDLDRALFHAGHACAAERPESFVKRVSRLERRIAKQQIIDGLKKQTPA